jgi:type I restriction enzyme S subunit
MRYAQKNDVIIVGAGENNIDIGVGVAYLGDEAVAVHDACYIFHHNEDPVYISYCLRTQEYHRNLKKYVSEGKICSISAASVGRMKIPVPPLPVQREIVRILDGYTERVAQLTEELAAELTARQKQYEYYRDQLLNFDVRGGGGN